MNWKKIYTSVWFWIAIFVLILLILWYLESKNKMNEKTEYSYTNNFEFDNEESSINSGDESSINSEVDIKSNIEVAESIHTRIDDLPKRKWKREEYCRSIFSRIYPSYDFKSCRPDFLINPKTGRRMELDGYCPQLKMAFEYNGQQHYVYPNSWHKTQQEFEDQLFRDALKKRLCENEGIYLITIPYTTPNSDLYDFIAWHLPEQVAERKRRREKGEPIESRPPGVNGLINNTT
jgi:hypothetical protein